MVLFLATGFTLALFTPTIFQPPQNEPVLNGRWAAAYEAAFNKNFPLRQPSVDTWGVLEYALFKKGRDGVLVGKNDWLFYSEEFQFFPEGIQGMQSKLELATTVQETLADSGGHLLVVIIPKKARIYSEHLGRYSLPDYAKEAYEVFATELEARNIPVVRLIDSFEEAKPVEAIFTRTDTHWAPYGAEIAAKEVAEAVAKKSLLPSLNITPYITTKNSTITVYRGDLMDWLPLGALEKRIGPPPDLVQERSVTLTDNSLDTNLLDTKKIPVTLVGTSYGANAMANFEGALRQALGADVINASIGGRGAITPMLEYLNSATIKDNPPELVIWEIPERFLEMNF